MDCDINSRVKATNLINMTMVVYKYQMQIAEEKTMVDLENLLNNQIGKISIKIDLQYKFASSPTHNVGYGGLLIFHCKENEIKHDFRIEIFPRGKVSVNNSIEVLSRENPLLKYDKIIQSLKNILKNNEIANSIMNMIYLISSKEVQRFNISDFKLVVNMKIDESGELFIYELDRET